MRAVAYQGPFSVTVENVEDTRIEAPTDVLVRITSTCICGSDLHMYERRTDAEHCLAGKTAFCLTVNPGFAGGAYGYVAMGPYTGGQAEYLRVPFADFNCLTLPPGDEHEDDFALQGRPRARRRLIPPGPAAR